MIATLSERISASLGDDKSSKHVDSYPFFSVAINHVRLTIPINSLEDHRVASVPTRIDEGAPVPIGRFEEYFAAPRSISANRVASKSKMKSRLP